LGQNLTIINLEFRIDVKAVKISPVDFCQQMRHNKTEDRWASGGVRFKAGARVVGHADPRTTALYAHVADRWRNNPALRLGVKVPL
jgi:integrase